MANGPRFDLPARIELDHERLRTRLTALLTARPADRELRFRELVADLARHETVESVVLYPAVEARVPGSDDLVERGIREADDLEQRLDRMATLDPASDGFLEAVRALQRELAAHTDAEEVEVLPALEANCPPEGLQALGERFVALKALTPTRPHPDTAIPELGNLLVGAPAEVYDRLREAVGASARHRTFDHR